MTAPCLFDLPARTPKKRAPALVAPWVRLVREGTPAPKPKIRAARDVATLCRDLVGLEHEEFHVFCLDSQSQVIARVRVTVGLLNASLCHPREVFRAAVACAAAGVTLVHNHPSGDPTPSAEDRAVTRQMVEAGRILNIPVYDHVIIGDQDRFTSFASEGWL